MRLGRRLAACAAAVALVGAVSTVPASALSDTSLDDVMQPTMPNQTVADTPASKMPDNPAVELPQTVNDTIPDDAIVVAENLAVTSQGELKNLESGQVVTDPELVGTAETQPDPLAKTSGWSFIPVEVGEVKQAVSDAQTAVTQPQSDTSASEPGSSAKGSAAVTPTAFGKSDYGAYWGTYNGSKAFFDHAGKLFVQQAKGVVDVSAWQENIDWAKAKADGVEGAIIRLGYGWDNSIDAAAIRNIRECKRLGIPFGVYWYSYADTASFAAGEGADTVAKLKQAGVSPSDLSYPVYYDLEQWTWTGHTPPTTPKAYEAIANAWYKKLQAAGYNNLALYSYTSYLNNQLNSTALRSKTTWVAQYGGSMQFTGFTSNFRGWQYTSAGHINGISGQVDLNAFGVAKKVVPVLKNIYRLYHVGVQVHHYTVDVNEMHTLVTRGWKYEGVLAKSVPSDQGRPVYRMYHPGIKQHHFTMSAYERDINRKQGWIYEGVAWYSSASSGGKPIYRLYNAGNKEHFYTSSYNEYQIRGSQGWNKEGIAWYSA